METSWVGLVSKNYEIEQARNKIRLLHFTSFFSLQAIMNMEQEYSYLKAKHQTRVAE